LASRLIALTSKGDRRQYPRNDARLDRIQE
jgi:hypothetical protein